MNTVNNIRKDIDIGNSVWIEAFKTQNAEMLVQYFHSEGAILTGSGTIVSKNELNQYLEKSMNTLGPTQFEISTIHVYETDEGIYEKGSYNMESKSGVSASGKYIVIWKYEEGKLKFFRDIGV